MKLHSQASFAITLFAILTNVFVAAQMYAYFQDSLIDAFIYNVMEAFGCVAMGLLSDKYCRRKANIITHMIGVVILVLIINHPGNIYLIFPLGFFYNPLPILRAGLVDNFTHMPRLYLLMISFVVQFIPWGFYQIYVSHPTEKMFTIALVMLLISAVGTFFFFEDKRDKNFQEKARQSRASLIHPSAKRRVWYTFYAYVVMQTAFFFADNLQESLADAPTFYSLLSTITILCVLLALTFRDISHVAVLRVNYGINAALTFIPLLAISVFFIPNFQGYYLVIMLAGFSAFTLPFVYDITMNSINANYRGTGCGILDFVNNAAALFNTSLIVWLNMDKVTSLLIIVLCVSAALLLQTRSEKRLYSHPS